MLTSFLLTTALASPLAEGFRGFKPIGQPVPAEAPWKGCEKGQSFLGVPVAWKCQHQIGAFPVSVYISDQNGQVLTVMVDTQKVEHNQGLLALLGIIYGPAEWTNDGFVWREGDVKATYRAPSCELRGMLRISTTQSDVIRNALNPGADEALKALQETLLESQAEYLKKATADL